VDRGLVRICHDIADGGLLVALAEMALAGGIGAVIEPSKDALPLHAWLFGEDQSRYIVAADDPDAILEAAQAAAVPARIIGQTGGGALTLAGGPTISLDALRTAHEGWLPDYMGTP